MKRRPFLKIAGATLGSYTLGVHPALALDNVGEDRIVKKVNGIPYRHLGKTGETVSIVTFPGLATNRAEQNDCNETVAKALDWGVNFFDVAPAYGASEEKLGKALKDHDRSKYLLACKTKMRDKEGAQKELENSLKLLNTDHFDLYQMHHLRTVEEVEQAFGPNGCMEMFFKAREEGKVRFLGFSAHTTKSALAAMKNHVFDTVMFPINFIEYFAFGFGKEIMQLAEEQGAGVLAIKPMCGGEWAEDEERTRNWWYKPLDKQEDVTRALSFALSQRGVVTGIPPAFLDLFEKAVEGVKAYHTPTEEDVEKLNLLASNSFSVFEERQKEAMLHGQDDDSESLFGCPYAYA